MRIYFRQRFTIEQHYPKIKQIMRKRLLLFTTSLVVSMLCFAQTPKQATVLPNAWLVPVDSSLLNVNAPARANTDVHIMGTDAPLYVRRTGTPALTGTSGIFIRPTYSAISGICESVSNANNIGVEGIVNGDVPGGTRIGILGVAEDGTTNFGVCGNIGMGTNSGAAIYGHATGSPLYYGVSGHFAGFFDGEVQITDQVIVPVVNTNSILGPSVGQDNMASFAQTSINNPQNTATASLASLNTYTYSQMPTAEAKSAASDEEDVEVSETLSEYYARPHHGLSADEVIEAYPELVYENTDGTQSINYMELIPILVQAINELKAEIDELKGVRSPSRPMMAPTQTTGLNTTPTTEGNSSTRYDLQGRRVKSEAKNNVIIRDGQKTIVK